MKELIRRLKLIWWFYKPKRKPPWHLGTISIEQPSKDYYGMTVTTTYGNGIIVDKRKHTVQVAFVKGRLIERKLKFKKWFHLLDIYQYFVITGTNKYPLHPDCYDYIIKENQRVEIEISRRGYAILTEREMKRCMHFKILNTTKEGKKIMEYLRIHGFEIRQTSPFYKNTVLPGIHAT